MNKPIVVLGGGGHASVLVEILRQLNQPIAAIVSPKLDENKLVFVGIKHLINDDDVLSFPPDSVLLVNGIGSLPGNQLRQEIYLRFASLGYHFLTLVSPHAIVSDYARLEDGVQIMANAVVQTGVEIGDNSIINTSASIDHDCRIGAHNHIAPAVTFSGDVTTGDSVHIGTAAIVIQGVHIGFNAVVGAGSIITKSVDADTICYPAKTINKGKNRNET